jgi:hypothetical protein
MYFIYLVVFHLRLLVLDLLNLDLDRTFYELLLSSTVLRNDIFWVFELDSLALMIISLVHLLLISVLYSPSFDLASGLACSIEDSASLLIVCLL